MKNPYFLVASYFCLSLTYCSLCHAELPPGFDDLPEEETSLVDVYVNKKEVVKTIATFDTETITFDNPQEIIDNLSQLKDPQVVLKRLTKPFATNEDKACQPETKKKVTCDFIQTKTIAVILNPRTYRATLVINPKYLLPSEKPRLKFHGKSTGNLAFVNQINAELATQSKEHTLTVNNNGILSHGNYSMASNWASTLKEDRDTHQTTDTIFAQDLYANYIHQRLNYRIGLTQSEGSILLPSFPVFGAKIATTNTLAYNSPLLSATPIQIDLTAPSFVYVYRGTTLIDTQYLQPGIHYLDTTRFPNGSYLVRIKILNIFNTERQVMRFFVKTQKVPLQGYPDYYFLLGRIRNSYQINNLNSLTGNPNYSIANGGGYYRMSRLWAIRYSGLVAPNEVLGSLGIIRLFSAGDIAIGGLYTNQGSAGVGVDINVRIFSKLQFNTLYRYLDLTNTEASLLQEKDHYESNLSTALNYNITPRLVYQTSISMNHVKGKSGLVYNIGNSINWNMVENDTLDVNLLLNGTVTENEALIELTLSFTLKTARYSIRLSHNQPQQYALHNNEAPGRKTQLTTLSGTISGEHYTGNATYNQGLDYRSYGFFSTMRNNIANTSLNLLHSKASAQQTTIGAAKLDTTLVANKQTVLFTSYNNTGVTLKIHTNQDHEFDILQSGSTLKTINSNQSYFLSLKPYQQYEINIASSHGVPFIITQNINKPILLYDKNIQTLYFTAKPAFNLITTFIFPDGTPAADMEVKGGLEYTRTDDSGLATVVTTNNAKLELINADKTCTVPIKNIKPEDGLAFVDELICQPQA